MKVAVELNLDPLYMSTLICKKRMTLVLTFFAEIAYTFFVSPKSMVRGRPVICFSSYFSHPSNPTSYLLHFELFSKPLPCLN